jgi:hypothetical protein
MSIKYLLPDAVIAYIQKRRLYLLDEPNTAEEEEEEYGLEGGEPKNNDEKEDAEHKIDLELMVYNFLFFFYQIQYVTFYIYRHLLKYYK